MSDGRVYVFCQRAVPARSVLFAGHFSSREPLEKSYQKRSLLHGFSIFHAQRSGRSRAPSFFYAEESAFYYARVSTTVRSDFRDPNYLAMLYFRSTFFFGNIECYRIC